MVSWGFESSIFRHGFNLLLSVRQAERIPCRKQLHGTVSITGTAADC